MTTYAPDRQPAGAPASSGGQFKAGSSPAGSLAVLDVPEASSPSLYGDLKGEDRIAAMKADLEAAINELVSSGQLGAYLDARRSNGMARWSSNNQFLVMAQVAHREGLEGWDAIRRLGSIDARTFKQWEASGRAVNKGEKAMWILAPNTRWVTDTDPKTGEEKKKQIIAGFRGTAVFEATQTDGDPIPEHPSKPFTGEVEPGTYEGLLSYARELGYTTREDEIADDPVKLKGTLAYVDPDAKVVVVDSRLSPEQKATAAAHEIGHIVCGHLDDDEGYTGHVRGRKESEAEAFAYLMMRERGAASKDCEAFAPGYIASWAQGDHKLISKALDKATKSFQQAMEVITWA